MNMPHLIPAVMRKLLCLSLLLCAAALASAAEKVSAITVVDTYGNSRQEFLDSLVAGSIGTQVGEELSLPQLSKDMAALAKLTGVSNVSYKIDRLEDGTIRITYLLAIRSRIQAITFEGNNHYKDSKLKSAIKTNVGDMPDETKIAEDRNILIKKYDEAGYHGTEVYSSLKTDEASGATTLTFIIQETERFKLKGVAFKGNTIVGSSELSSEIMTKRQWWRYIFRLGNYYNESLREVDIDKIIGCYAKKGYMDCQVTDVSLDIEDKTANPQWVTPVYTISEGIQYRLGKRSFKGNIKFSDEQLLARCAMKEGDVYGSDAANVDLEAMKALYQELGHLDLLFYPEEQKHPESGFVDIVYVVNEGSASTIRNIIISGNADTSDRVIRRELAIFEDDLADQRKIDRTKERLDNLGYFSSVEIVPKATDSPEQRDLNIQLEEKPTGMVSVGAGYSTEDSVMGFMEVSESNFSIQRLLKLQRPKGDGQRARLYVGIGANSSSFSLQHTEPSLFDSQFSLTNEAFLTTRYEDDYDERHIGYAISLSWPVAFELPFLDHTEYWDITTGLRIEQIRINKLERREKFDEDDGVPSSEWRFPEGRNYSLKRDEGSKFANRFELSLVRDTRNHFIFPNRGSRFSIDMELITKALGSYSDYVKFHSGIESFHPVYSDVFLRLALNGFSISQLGGEKARVFDRYFAGGYGTVRGFKRHDISPVNRNETSIGGKTMVVGTVEFIQPVANFMYLKLFSDWGNVWWGEFDADIDKLNGSVGVGIQFKKIPIRLDYGYPICTHGEHLHGKSGRLHFSIDYAF